MDVIFVLFK